MKRMSPVLLPTLVLVTAGLVFYLAVVFLAQRWLIFPAPPAAFAVPAPAGVEALRLAIDNGSVEAWYLPPSSRRSASAPLLIFTHGNAELASHWFDGFDEPRRWGCGVLLVEYPGYGRSAGTPSESSITATMLAAYQWAIDDPRVDRSRIVAIGRSIGSGAAAALAARQPLAAVVLLSPFTSLSAMARRFLVPPYLIRDPFDNVAHLNARPMPVLIIHGDHDTVIPISQGRALAAAVPGSEFEAIDAPHDYAPPWPRIERFLTHHEILPAALDS